MNNGKHLSFYMSCPHISVAFYCASQCVEFICNPCIYNLVFNVYLVTVIKRILVSLSLSLLWCLLLDVTVWIIVVL
jgi:hypothetical protein